MRTSTTSTAWMQGGVEGGGSAQGGFADAMWAEYRDSIADAEAADRMR